MEATIEVEGLRKRFGPAVALDGMTFTVAPGQVTGFVGPNGAARATARTTRPLRASRYAVTSSAAAPAIVTSSNRASDSKAATYTASAAGRGRSHPAGTVPSRQNAPISNAVGRLIPACAGGPAASPACTVDFEVSRMASSVTESSPSTVPSATGPKGRAAESMFPIVAAGQGGRIAPHGGPAVPRVRDAAGRAVPPGSDREDGSVA